MTPDLLLQSIEEILKAKVEGTGGKVLICSDRMHGYELLLDAPGKAYRVAVSLGSMKAAGKETSQVWGGPVQDVEITMTVIRPAGLTVQPGHAVYKPTASGGLSLLQRAEQPRRLLAGARWKDAATGLPRPDVDPDGVRFADARILHLESKDPGNGFLPCAELTFHLRITLPPPDQADCQDWTQTP